MPPGLNLAGKESREHRDLQPVCPQCGSQPCPLSAGSSQCRQGVRQRVTLHGMRKVMRDTVRSAGEVLGLDVLGIYFGVLWSVPHADSLTVSGI